MKNLQPWNHRKVDVSAKVKAAATIIILFIFIAFNLKLNFWIAKIMGRKIFLLVVNYFLT